MRHSVPFHGYPGCNMRKSVVKVNAFRHEKIAGSWKKYMISADSTISPPPVSTASGPELPDQLVAG